MIKFCTLIALLLSSTSVLSETIIETPENIFTAEFSEIRKHPYVDSQYAFYKLTNIGAHDIDDIVLSLSLLNSNGDYLIGNAVNVITPGLIWLKIGESTDVGIPVDDHPEVKALVLTNPEAVRLQIKIRKITFLENQQD